MRRTLFLLEIMTSFSHWLCAVFVDHHHKTNIGCTGLILHPTNKDYPKGYGIKNAASISDRSSSIFHPICIRLDEFLKTS